LCEFVNVLRHTRRNFCFGRFASGFMMCKILGIFMILRNARIIYQQTHGNIPESSSYPQQYR